MRQRRDILESPLEVQNEDGRVKVLLRIGRKQEDMGEALTLDSIAGSADAEVVAVGPSDKGPDRGAILRHGANTLWSFKGKASDMTPAGRALFVNTVAYAAKHRGARVLETRRNGTRDSLLSSIAFARRSPGYLETMRRLYLPEELGESNLDEVEKWLAENRPYLRTENRRFEVDAFAKRAGIANHSRKILEHCLQNLSGKIRVGETLETLRRYTGRGDLGDDARAWRSWYAENKEYLYFSDCEGYRFKVDEEAKAEGIPFEKLRGWSSERVDYRFSGD